MVTKIRLLFLTTPATRYHPDKTLMNPCKLLCCLAAVMFAGCATDDREADTFFKSGWLWPKSMENRKPSPVVDDSAPLKP
jgi:hypothetical protein